MHFLYFFPCGISMETHTFSSANVAFLTVFFFSLYIYLSIVYFICLCAVIIFVCKQYVNS